MTPEQAAEYLANVMNTIEDEGYILYPHPRPVGISIRVSREGFTECTHPDHTQVVARIWDEGDGLGWHLR